jgi:hypothetical protein
MQGIRGHITINISRIEGDNRLDLCRADGLLVGSACVYNFFRTPTYTS